MSKAGTIQVSVPPVIRRSRKELGQIILTASIGRYNGSMSESNATEFLIEGAKGLMRKRGRAYLLEAWNSMKDSIEKDKYIIIQQRPGVKSKVKLFYDPLKEYIQKLSQ